MAPKDETPAGSRLSLRPVVSYGGIVIAILVLIAVYSGYTLDFPYADQWDFVPILEKARTGDLTGWDFWAQHNEHRLVFPRLLMLALATPSNWSVRWELAANFVLAFLTWLLLCAQARMSGREVRDGANDVVYLIFALIIFSLSQWGNWFLGWQLQEFMNVLAVVAAMFTLTWQRYSTLGVVLACVFGTIATYSFANGMLVWPIGILLLWLQREERGAASRPQMVAWCLVAVAMAISYLAGYEAPPHHTSLAAALGQPLQCALYVLAYLGQPLGHAEDLVSLAVEISGYGTGHKDHTFSILMGALGLLLWTVTFFQLLLSGVPIRSLAPWLGLALYAFCTAVLTALGRVDEGIDQAVSSRYVTLANLLWLSVAVQSFWAGHVLEAALIKRAWPVKVGIMCAALLGASLAGAYRWTERYHVYAPLRQELLAGTDMERLRPLYPPAPEQILERREALRSLGLSVFAPGEGATASPQSPTPPHP